MPLLLTEKDISENKSMDNGSLVELNFGSLHSWALNTLTWGGKSVQFPMCISQKPMADSSIGNIVIEYRYFLNCKYFYKAPCDELNVINNFCNSATIYEIKDHWSSEIRNKTEEYRKVIESIATGEINDINLDNFFECCHTIKELLHIKTYQKFNVYNRLAQLQSNKCIINSCQVYDKLGNHRCLHGRDGGEYVIDNCVLVCNRHHKSLEKFSNKNDVLNYAKSM